MANREKEKREREAVLFFHVTKKTKKNNECPTSCLFVHPLCAGPGFFFLLFIRCQARARRKDVVCFFFLFFLLLSFLFTLFYFPSLTFLSSFDHPSSHLLYIFLLPSFSHSLTNSLTQINQPTHTHNQTATMGPTIILSRKPEYLTAECISCNTPVEFLMPKANGEVIYIECYQCKQVLSIDIQYPQKGATASSTSSSTSANNSSKNNSSNTKKDTPASKSRKTGTGTGTFFFCSLSSTGYSRSRPIEQRMASNQHLIVSALGHRCKPLGDGIVRYFGSVTHRHRFRDQKELQDPRSAEPSRQEP